MKRKPTEEDLTEIRKHLKYYLYDCIDSEKGFYERHMFLRELLGEVNDRREDGTKYKVFGTINFVQTIKAESKEDLDKFYARWIEEGFEGQMVRVDMPYETKRSKYLLKRKEFEDAEFKVIGVEEGTGNRSGMAGKLICLLPDGRTFGAPVSGGVEVNIDLLKRKEEVIGQMASSLRSSSTVSQTSSSFCRLLRRM
jgi:DNA ligase-1